jgi:hypothetical protein
VILLPARTSQFVRLLMNSHSFLSRTLMEALHENVELTEVIKVLTPFSGGIYREKDLRWVIAPSRLCKEH